MPAILSTTAMRELDSILDQIQQDSPRSAMRFLESIEKTGDYLATFPEMGRRLDTADPKLADLRICLVTGFEKYLLVYRIRDDGVHIERIVHGARDLPNLLKEGS